jgi:hypothetical protein
MKSVDSGHISKAFLPTMFFLLILTTSHVFGTQVVLSSSDLPYIVGTGDSVTFTGTRAVTNTGGLYVRDGATNVLINLGTDTLVFGANNSDNNYGIRVARSLGATQNVVIKGGWVIHGGNDNSNGNACVELAGCNGVLIDSVSTIINGTNGKCITSVPLEGRAINATNGSTTSWRSTNRNIEIRGGTHKSYVTGYTSRCSYDGAVIHLAAKDVGIAGSEYNYKVHGLKVENAPCQGIVVYGVAEIYGCSVTVDSRNFMYTYPSANFCYSAANAYGILARLVDAGSKFYDNVLLAGDTYYGADGGFEVEGCLGTSSKPIEFYNNYINTHRGWDVHYGFNVQSKGFKMRRADEYNYTNSEYYSANRHIKIYNNEIYLYSHTDTTNFKAYGPGVAGFYIIAHVDRNDSSIVIENNYIRSVVLDTIYHVGSVPILATGFQFLANDAIGQYTIRNNRMESNDAFYRYGGYDPGGSYYSCYGDTLIAIDTASGPVTQHSGKFWPGDIGDSLTNNYIRDAYYVPDTLYKMFAYRSGVSSANVTLQRTLKIYVRGNNDLPVVNAACSVWNDYNHLVFSGLTDSGGCVSGVGNYMYERAGSGDSLGYNDFRIKAVKGTDFNLNTAFTVGPGSAGFTDTLTLNNTEGTGTWGAGGDISEDTVSPGRIDDLSAVTGTNAGEVVLSWTAPGDDGAIGTASGYDIRYSLQPITSYNFAYASQVTNPPSPLLTGSTHNFTVGSLTPAATYFFAIRSWDDADNVSMISNVVSAVARSSGVVDQTPPGTIDDLDAVTGANNGEIVISWTAPGDDGATGTATSYNIRYSLNPITAVNFAAAAAVTNPPAPQPSGTHQSFIVGGLTPAQVYYFAIRASDDVGNLSGVSNTTAAEAYFDLGTGDDDPPVTDDLMLYPEDNSIVASTRPTLQVVNVDANPQNVYHFEIAHDSFFVTLATSVNNIAQESGETTSWRIEQPLESGRVYYWRARANDGNFGAVFNFKVQPDAHAYPNPFIPGHHNHTTFTGIPDGSALHIMTLTGELVKSWSATGGDVAWDGTNSSGNPVASGVYLWYVADGDLSGKIIVKR